YLGALEEKLSDLRRSPSRPDDETLNSYNRKLEFLKGVISSNQLVTPEEKVMANQLLSPGATTNVENKVTTKILLQTKAKHEQELRDELFSRDEHDGPRLRKNLAGNYDDDETGDFDAVLKYHNEMQDKLAEEMVLLAQNLKQNSLLAGHIIKKDTEILTKSTNVAEENFGKLKAESDSLETHTKTSCQWWIWLSLIVVCITFISMIMFMKIFTKNI
ncbi:USE1 (predicted), partial [Pycnogonum litorale]